MFLEKGVAAFPDVAAAVSEGRSLRQGKGGNKGTIQQKNKHKTKTCKHRNTKNAHENTVKRRTLDNEGQQIGESQQTSNLSYMIFKMKLVHHVSNICMYDLHVCFLSGG